MSKSIGRLRFRRAALCVWMLTSGPALAAGSRPAPDTPSKPAASLSLRNGIAVTLAPIAGADLVALRVRLEAGSLYDGPRHGLSALATSLIGLPVMGEAPDHPTLHWTLEADPTAFTNFRWIELSATSRPENLRSLLTAVAARLGRASGDNTQSLPEIQLERLRAEAIERAHRLEETDAAAFWARGVARLYPPGSPHARPPWGPGEGMAALSVDDVRNFLARHAVPSRTAVTMSGALDVGRTASLLRETLGHVSPGKPSKDRVRSARPQGQRSFTLIPVPRPPRVEDTVVMVWPGDRSKAWDRAATEAIVFLLGESSAAASLEEDGGHGFLVVRARAERGAGTAVAERLRSVLEIAAKGGFTAADLEKWRGAAAAAARLEAEDPAALARALAGARSGGGSRPGGQLTLAQLNDTARRLFKNGFPVAFVTAR